MLVVFNCYYTENVLKLTKYGLTHDRKDHIYFFARRNLIFMITWNNLDTLHHSKNLKS